MSDETEGAPEEAGEGPAAGDGAEVEGAVVFVDASLEETADLASALGAPVRAIAPDALEPASLTESDRAVVIAWDPEESCALDTVEYIRMVAPAADLPIVVASGAPTRRRVLAALHAGATSFAFQPYDADELRERLGLAKGEAPAAESAPGEG